jgi:hypothetical protein
MLWLTGFDPSCLPYPDSQTFEISEDNPLNRRHRVRRSGATQVPNVVVCVQDCALSGLAVMRSRDVAISTGILRAHTSMHVSSRQRVMVFLIQDLQQAKEP